MAQQTSLAAAITTTGQSSITVTEYLGFPSTGSFAILIDAEVLTVTAGNGTTTWTVSRGQQGTTAATHSNGATITHVPDALAELGDLVATLALDGIARYSMLADLLVDVSADINASCMRSFFVPTADVTVYLDVSHSCASLVDASGGFWTADGRALDIVSITNLYVRPYPGESYVELTAGDTGYYLEGGPPGTGVSGTDWPYEDITLSRIGSYPVWPLGKRAVKIVGKLGFPATPAVVKRAAISEARERFRQTIGGGGGPSQIGVNAFGQPIFLTGLSSDMRRVLNHPFSRRPMAA